MLVGQHGRRVRDPAETHYKEVPLADIKEQFEAQKMFSTAEWRNLFADGTVTKWLQHVTDFLRGFANIQNAVPASKYFDPKIYLETVKA